MTSSTITLAEFIESNGLTMDVEWAESNPSMASDAEWARSASHYLCTIHNADGATMSVPFSMGSAHTEEPTLEMVLDAIGSDAAGVVNSPHWLDWADEMGFTGEGVDEMRKARETYQTIERQTEELRAILSGDAFETLLWNTERL